MIISKHCSDKLEVTKLLNEFESRGYNIAVFFINIVHTSDGFEVFYDEALEEIVKY